RAAPDRGGARAGARRAGEQRPAARPDPRQQRLPLGVLARPRAVRAARRPAATARRRGKRDDPADRYPNGTDVAPARKAPRGAGPCNRIAARTLACASARGEQAPRGDPRLAWTPVWFGARPGTRRTAWCRAGAAERGGTAGPAAPLDPGRARQP